MADRRYEDEQRRDRGSRRDPDTERRIERRADRYRGSDERGYGGGERLGRDWERGDAREAERFDRDVRVRSYDEQRFDRGGRDVRREAPVDRDRRRPERVSRGASPSGAFNDRGPQGYGEDMRDTGPHRRRDHSRLAGLHDLESTSELRERYREHRRQRDFQPRYGHGPGVENMEAPRLGYSTSTTRGDDHELGHGGFLGAGGYRSGTPMGRGPKGYQRSDDRIREDICDRLMMSWMNAENVEVQVRDGEVTLTGMVKSRDEKRAIEALAESVLGVKDLNNAIRVERRDQSPVEARSEQASQGQPMAKPQPQGERRADEQAQSGGNAPLHS
jgi:hypothetical protein